MTSDQAADEFADGRIVTWSLAGGGAEQSTVRIAKIAAGFGLLASGIAMLALPGPGWLAIAAGVGLLAEEFHWARRLSDTLKLIATQFGRRVTQGKSRWRGKRRH
jgi:hypothetical protein